MFKYDTFNPLRTLEAVKLFLKGFWLNGRYYPPIAGGDDTNPPPPPPATTGVYAIPEDIKADPIFEKYKTQEERDRALISAQKFLGREKLPVPKDANDKETLDLIFKTLGLPDKEDGYVIPTDLQIPEDLPLDETLLTDFRKTAHSLGILPQQFAGLYKWYMSSMAESFKKTGEQQTAFTQEAETNLRKKWGAAYQQNVVLAKKVFQSFADEKAFAEFDKGFGNNPVLIEFFANIGKVLSEDQLTGKPTGLTLTPDEAQAEINKIKSDLKHPYWIGEHPLHNEAVANMERLMKLTMVGE